MIDRYNIRHRGLLSSTVDAVCHTGSTDERVWVNDDTALFVGIVDNEASPVAINAVSIHLYHVTRPDVHVQPEENRNPAT